MEKAYPVANAERRKTSGRASLFRIFRFPEIPVDQFWPICPSLKETTNDRPYNSSYSVVSSTAAIRGAHYSLIAYSKRKQE